MSEQQVTSDAGWLSSRVGSIAGALRAASPGELAALRRMGPDGPTAPAFWRLFATTIDPDDRANDDATMAWATIVSAMADAPTLDERTQAGQAMAQAGLSEARFVRLLEAEGSALLDEFRQVARYLAAKGRGLAWTDMAALLLVKDREARRKIRGRLARFFFRQRKEEA